MVIDPLLKQPEKRGENQKKRAVVVVAHDGVVACC